MNRQSNTYTIIYSTVLVVLVGVVLSVVYQALRPKQVENIQNDTRRQILAAALITPSEGQDIATLWQEHITASYIVNDKGEKVTDAKVDPFDVKVDQEVKKAPDQRLLPVFECNTDKGTKYILPVYGLTWHRNRKARIPEAVRGQGRILDRRSVPERQGSEERPGTRHRRLGTRHIGRYHHIAGRSENAS